MSQNKNDSQAEDGANVPDKLVRAESKIKANPYDTEAWSLLIRNAQLKVIEDARAIYERLVTQFPNAGRYWKIYIEHEVYTNTLAHHTSKGDQRVT